MAITDTPILGFEGTLTIAGVTPGYRNLRFGTSFSEVDATTSRHTGEKAYLKGLKDSFISFDLLVDDGSACAAVMAAVNSREPVAVSVTCGDSGLTLAGSMLVFGGEVSMDMDNVATMTCTCRKFAGTVAP